MLIHQHKNKNGLTEHGFQEHSKHKKIYLLGLNKIQQDSFVFSNYILEGNF